MKPIHLLSAYTLFIFAVIIAAYLHLFPLTLHIGPNDDSIGHFILYGLWGYLFGRAFYKPAFKIGRWYIQKGIAVVIPLVIAEELLQSFSPARTFSFFDMAWGVLGILIGSIVLNYQHSVFKTSSEKILITKN